MIWFGIVAVAAGSFLFRASMLFRPGARDLPPTVDRAVTAVAPAVIAAMVVADMTGDSAGGVAWGDLAAAALTLLVARRRRSLVTGAYAGMAFLWLAAVVGP